MTERSQNLLCPHGRGYAGSYCLDCRESARHPNPEHLRRLIEYENRLIGDAECEIFFARSRRERLRRRLAEVPKVDGEILQEK